MALTENEVARFFFAIVLLLGSAHTMGYIALKFRMPRVIGEIIGGILLGPSFFGYFLPKLHSWIFFSYTDEAKLISSLYWIGLVLLMFISGFEMDTNFEKKDSKTALAVFIGSTFLPFIAGWHVPEWYGFSSFAGSKFHLVALKIVVGIAFAVTSIPVISKIFIELEIIKTRFARVVLATATAHDVILWAALATAMGILGKESPGVTGILRTILFTITLFGIGLLLMPSLVAKLSRLRVNLLVKSSLAGYALFLCFLFAALASSLNVNIVFGAFVAGIIYGSIPDERFLKIKEHIREFSLSFFIPIYFAVVGFKIDLLHHFHPFFLLAFLSVSAFMQTLGTIIAARSVGRNWLTSLNLSVAMNARGGPGIVLATVAYDAGIINEGFFVTLVLAAILTSLFAGYWFRFVLARNWPLMD